MFVLQAPELWSDIESCLNEGRADASEECKQDGEHGIVFQLNITKLISNRNITFLCVADSDEPEITSIHLIYDCKSE